MSKNFPASTLALLRDDAGFSHKSSLGITKHKPDYHVESMSGCYESAPAKARGRVLAADRRGQRIDGASTAAARSLRGLNLPASA